MRLDIRYRMAFDYDQPVWESQNEIRVKPRDDERQRVIAYRLTPAPSARVMSFVDYWGTTVDHVGVRQPHVSFELVAEAAVETTPHQPVIDDAPGEALSVPEFRLPATEYLAPSPHVQWTESLSTMVADVIAPSASVRERITGVLDLVDQSIQYERGSTEIGISLTDLINGGVGVCQDYAHLSIGMLRSMGVPARYVSGYLFAADESAADDHSYEPVRVQTHAWVEALVPGLGWHAIDPTNRRPVGARHVVIGHGRDYDDVAPVRGAYLGSGVPQVDAEVEIRRMEQTQASQMGSRPRRLSIQQLDEHRRQSQDQQQQ